ncbi:MAG: hypothetical protein J7513_07005 [Solirubrobacteraceae bacterium]|nr:hypothetical protein [Solirubrobacteraceae bacterium]
MRFPVDRFRRVRRALLALVLGTVLVVPQPALASGTDVWNDCGDADGAINHKHSQADYSDALKNPPADGAEYSNCLDLIRQAQIRDANAGSGGGGGTGGGGTGSNSGGGTSSSGEGSAAVAPAELSSALKSSGVDPAAPAPADAPAPAPVTVDGKQIDLASERVPSIAGALSLPLPLAASAVVVLLSAGLPLARYVVARFGGTPTGTTSTTP